LNCGVFNLDKKSLEEYEQRENEEYERFKRDIEAGKTSFENKIYPPTERFIKLQKPIATANPQCKKIDDLWAQVPFSGSLIFTLQVCPKNIFEAHYFKTSEIPKIIEFTKETGRLQFALQTKPTAYAGLDYLDPFFEELKPPVLYGIPIDMIGTKYEYEKATADYANFSICCNREGESFFGILKEASYKMRAARLVEIEAQQGQTAYFYLKKKYPDLAEIMAQLLRTNPRKAWHFIKTSYQFIVVPEINLISNQYNYSLNELKDAKQLPSKYRPRTLYFPCEIGRFLMKKLTYAPIGLDACKELMYHYDAYDLRKVQDALNTGIVTNKPDLLYSNVNQLSEILDNIWNDKRLPHRIKGLRIGVPISIAAIGAAFGTFISGPAGATTIGFLATLGYDLAHKFIEKHEEGMCESISRRTVKSYQANVYDFKKAYKQNIVK
jgi:hypothetical protein